MLKKTDVRKRADGFPCHLTRLQVQGPCSAPVAAVKGKPEKLHPTELLLGTAERSIWDTLGLLWGPEHLWCSTAEQLCVISTFQDLVPSGTNKVTSLHLGKKEAALVFFLPFNLPSFFFCSPRHPATPTSPPFGIIDICCKCEGSWGRISDVKGVTTCGLCAIRRGMVETKSLVSLVQIICPMAFGSKLELHCPPVSSDDEGFVWDWEGFAQESL